MTLTKPRKLTWTKSLMVSPVFASTVCTTSFGPPRPYAALILLKPCPGMFTQESRGMLITVTRLRSPDTWISIIVSELELTSSPTCSASSWWRVSPERWSTPASSTFSGPLAGVPAVPALTRPMVSLM